MPRNWTTEAKWTNFQKHTNPKLNQVEAESLNRPRVESRNQPQGRSSKTLKLMDIEQHAIKQ